MTHYCKALCGSPVDSGSAKVILGGGKTLPVSLLLLVIAPKLLSPEQLMMFWPEPLATS